jgi:hypothetical protein
LLFKIHSKKSLLTGVANADSAIWSDLIL